MVRSAAAEMKRTGVRATGVHPVLDALPMPVPAVDAQYDRAISLYPRALVILAPLCLQPYPRVSVYQTAEIPIAWCSCKPGVARWFADIPPFRAQYPR